MAAVKCEETKKNEQLAYESKIIRALHDGRGSGIPKMHWYGTDNSLSQYTIMIIEMLGPSLEDLYSLCNKRFSLKTVLMIAIQMVCRIEYIHNKNYIHRDIKPENFLMGINKTSHVVFLIDYGLAKRYRDPKNLHHIQYKENKNLTGTARYASIHSHLGIEQSRRDDLESIGYLLIYFLKGGLPWQKMKANNKQEKYHKIMEKKQTTVIDIMCKDLPIEICNFIKYTRNLTFEDKPDYSFLRNSLKNLFYSLGHEMDYLYDWTDSNKVQHNAPSTSKLPIDIRFPNNDQTNKTGKSIDSVFKTSRQSENEDQQIVTEKIQNSGMVSETSDVDGIPEESEVEEKSQT